MHSRVLPIRGLPKYGPPSCGLPTRGHRKLTIPSRNLSKREAFLRVALLGWEPY